MSVEQQDQRWLKDRYKGKALKLKPTTQKSVPIGRYSRTTNNLQKSSNAAEYNITQMTNICQ